jgi:hypothetical protein
LLYCWTVPERNFYIYLYVSPPGGPYIYYTGVSAFGNAK